MKQIIQFDEQLKNKIGQLETASEEICRRFSEIYQPEFTPFGQHLILELIRTKKGSATIDCFQEDYESYIEVGIEQDDEYFPNGYIPLWKCKEEWFQKTGYMTDKEETEISEVLKAMVEEMLQENWLN